MGPLGYIFGCLTGAVAAQALDFVYILADLLSKNMSGQYI